MNKEHVFYVKGMHCSSCEVLIEKKLLELNGIKSVEASTPKEQVLIEYVGDRPRVEDLNRLFKKGGYVFSDVSSGGTGYSQGNIFKSIVIALVLIVGFLFINKLGFANSVNVNSKSSLGAFLVFGLLAGFSTCAALVGGIVLSMSKQWADFYPGHSMAQKLQPHLMFNAGRLLFFAVLGAILGGIGSKLQVSLGITSVLIILISLVMLVLGLQMLGLKSFQRVQFTLPKFVTRYISDETKFKGRYLPFLMGGLTFFLPCGFTLTAQGVALLSGNILSGGLIMFFFALGTVPALFLIGLSSAKFSEKPHRAAGFLKVAGILVLFFALFNLNSQLNILGLPSFNNLTSTAAAPSQTNDLPPMINGQQVIKMDASSRGYVPNKFIVKVNVPVRWEITDKGVSGCTNAVIARGLFDGEISLKSGGTSVKEFTPTKIGRYKFSCWMGMIAGAIEVIN